DSGAYWVFAGNNTIDSTTTLTNSGTLFDAGDMTLATGVSLTTTNGGLVAVAGSLVNRGQVSGRAYSLQVLPGGYLENDATGTITRTGSGFGFAPNHYYNATVYIRSGGTATLANFGTIRNPNYAGVVLGGGAQIVNGASGNATALISARGDAVIELYG